MDKQRKWKVGQSFMMVMLKEFDVMMDYTLELDDSRESIKELTLFHNNDYIIGVEVITTKNQVFQVPK